MGRLVWAASSIALLLAACTGDQGPMGPAGPPGPPGPGAASIVMAGALDTDGEAFIHLPPAAGTIARPPNLACYTTADPVRGVYTIIAIDRVQRLDGEEESLGVVDACLLAGHENHVDVAIFSVPGGSFIIVATPTI